MRRTVLKSMAQIAPLCPFLLALCACAYDRRVDLEYNVVGQCDTAYDSFSEDNGYIADIEHTAYIILEITRVRNVRPQAVPFALERYRLYFQNGPDIGRFDSFDLVSGPVRRVFPVGDFETRHLLYSARLGGFASTDHPAREAAMVDWPLLYDTAPDPPDQGVLAARVDQPYSNQVQVRCRDVKLPG